MATRCRVQAARADNRIGFCLCGPKHTCALFPLANWTGDITQSCQIVLTLYWRRLVAAMQISENMKHVNQAWDTAAAATSLREMIGMKDQRLMMMYSLASSSHD
jgi:hypothetical protein